MAQEELHLPPPPKLPDDVKARFPSLSDWEKEFQLWWRKVTAKLRE